ncbi:hypothetical protein crov318 [Cafeteria roenbergensis virus]|uniref:Uncharacterized protein n=1 Tax=Cafeteria roenbergensis virus (strain BV-PW1) TaxID=693272 RepID=E3T589_CROVB|nr:hypothetical protein crov318 [Cafeteria roenbergensis virus BV-PW1]ADO67352.1 hypothetical protein crov318 [Cafeteria roenbergensis virus BV-PW1]
MDNHSPSCPPLMSDRRIFTNYFDNDVFNQTIRMMNKIEDNHSYRIFLQQNAAELINREREYNLKTNTCSNQGVCSWQK